MRCVLCLENLSMNAGDMGGAFCIQCEKLIKDSDELNRTYAGSDYWSSKDE